MAANDLHITKDHDADRLHVTREVMSGSGGGDDRCWCWIRCRRRLF